MTAETAESDTGVGGRLLRVGVVAGEASGDALGAGLIAAIQERVPGTEFVGIAGPRELDRRRSPGQEICWRADGVGCRRSQSATAKVDGRLIATAEFLETPGKIL